MEAVGFIFGLLGFITASSATRKLKRIEAELRQKGLLTQ
jgi:hypothetical protein